MKGRAEAVSYDSKMARETEQGQMLARYVDSGKVTVQIEKAFYVLTS
jgi:hypothetical protein